MRNEASQTNGAAEPVKETEIVCDYCRPNVRAVWDVVTNEHEVLFVCHKHHAVLLEKDLVFIERRMGEEIWEEIRDDRALLNKVDMEKHE